MQDKYAQALALLQASKEKGLSYYEATQSLKSQGFDQQTIEDVSNRFDYRQGVMHTPDTQPHGITPEEHEAEKQKLDQELEDVEAQARQDRVDESLGRTHFL